jgi:HD-GYP domain-containing protein (c-di-GMP phosphodiesterase class II)
MTAHPPRPNIAALSRAAVLSLALAVCISSACSSSKSKETPEQKATAELGTYQADIRRVVKDKTRADQMIALTSEFHGLVATFARSFQDQHERVAVLNANYGASLAEFQDLFSQIDKERAQLIDKAFALRARMTALTTEEEWTQLKKVRIAEWQDELAEAQS